MTDIAIQFGEELIVGSVVTQAAFKVRLVRPRFAWHAGDRLATESFDASQIDTIQLCSLETGTCNVCPIEDRIGQVCIEQASVAQVGIGQVRSLEFGPA